MRVLKWTPDFDPRVESPIVPIWVEFPWLPVHLFAKDALWRIAGNLGSPLLMDTPTRIGSRPSVAGVFVQMDLTKKFPRRIWVGQGSEGRWRPIRYKNVPSYCRSCFHIGHVEDQCFKSKDRGFRNEGEELGKVDSGIGFDQEKAESGGGVEAGVVGVDSIEKAADDVEAVDETVTVVGSVAEKLDVVEAMEERNVGKGVEQPISVDPFFHYGEGSDGNFYCGSSDAEVEGIGFSESIDDFETEDEATAGNRIFWTKTVPSWAREKKGKRAVRDLSIAGMDIVPSRKKGKTPGELDFESLHVIAKAARQGEIIGGRGDDGGWKVARGKGKRRRGRARKGDPNFVADPVLRGLSVTSASTSVAQPVTRASSSVAQHVHGNC